MTALTDKFIDWKTDINSISEDSLDSEAKLGTDSSSIVDIINSVLTKIGNLSILNPNTSLVAEINAIESSDKIDGVGTLGNLNTDDKSSAVSATNEIHDYIGNYSGYVSIVSDINNLDAPIGNISSLQTVDKSSLVDAINELDSNNIESALLFSLPNISFNQRLAFEKSSSDTLTLYPGSGTINGTLHSWGTLTKTGLDNVALNSVIYIYLVGGSTPTIEFLTNAPTWDTTKKEWLYSSKRCIGWYKTAGFVALPFKGSFDGEEMTVRYYTDSGFSLLKTLTYQSTVGTMPITSVAPSNLINKFAVRIMISTYNLVGADMMVAIGPTTWSGGLQGAVAAVRSDNSITGNKWKMFGEMWIPNIPGTTPNWVAYRYASTPEASVYFTAGSFRV